MKRVIEQKDRAFFIPPTKIIYIYSNYQPIYDEMRTTSAEMVFIKYIPNEAQLEALTSGHDHSLLICDDQMAQVATTSHISNIFTRLSHHLRMSTFLLLQSTNMTGSRYAGDIVRNCHYTLLFKAGQNGHLIRSLGSRINDYKNLSNAYKIATAEGQFKYLCVNTHPKAAEMEKFTSQILPDDPYCLVYIARK
jgi:hypothetical protein